MRWASCGGRRFLKKFKGLRFRFYRILMNIFIIKIFRNLNRNNLLKNFIIFSPQSLKNSLKLYFKAKN
nr:MAG TPA: hypothetical protein [Caudoviricetes sp.]